ncbi:fibrinogen C domain-containing protein 1-like isoform X2 [Danaus plexippus]|uniref:fibrinogen C domain-containing protein 1-like isoform X2 n=1 Tax=Danaus plexippus TaxID=13037 RepID=UPI0013C4541B|nr:fibrinogen C domain-containing protein 1-like isoform X2 [Danaus plexippus]
MFWNAKILLVAIYFYVVSTEPNRDRHPRRKNERLDSSLWKKEYESELTDALLTSKRAKNLTRLPQSTSSDEAVLERLMETITSSERYLKKIESIDFRLNRLDIEVHEKTNLMLKRLTEINTALQNQGPDKADTSLDTLKTDVGQLKYYFENKLGPINKVEDGNCNLEGALDSRLSFLETNMKSVLNGVEAITAVISEVKNRQKLRTFNKNDQITGNLDATTLISEFRRVLMEQKPKKCDCKLGRVDRSERYPTDCQEIQAQGFNVTGIYKIKPEDMEPFYVLCDLNTVGGGWTVIQNRFDGSQDFYKNWNEYKHGFGNLASEFWLGLEKVYYLTNQKLYELRVEMETQIGQEASATFSVFTIGPEYESYRISTLGTYRGNAGDSLSYHAGQKFSTYEIDNDEWKDGSCAVEHGGAWWYKECDKSNLNGKYMSGTEENNGQAVYWISFKGPNSPLSKTRMMIRPLPASRPQEYTEQLRKLSENPKPDVKRVRGKEMKSAYDGGRARAPYRYEDSVRQEVFFPNYT